MPWEETHVMDARIQFVAAYLSGEKCMAELCRERDISRKTGYKWVARYNAEGAAGLVDRSSAPHTRPNAVTDSTVDAIVAVRRKHRTWGPKKILAWLATNQPTLSLPAVSTAHEVLSRYGLVTSRKKRNRRVPPDTEPFSACDAPNAIWCADYKGQFRTGDLRYCYPLTISDAYCRYLLECFGRANTRHRFAKPVFETAFKEYGLPNAIRSDNGPPFATKAPCGLSRLSIWWLKLGIRHERIDPGHPEQNGRHERMHRTLKAEATKPPGRTMRSQQKKFDDFRREFNFERPHEAIGLKTPGSIYTPSTRLFPARLPEFTYPDDYAIRRVHASGRIRWPGRALIHLGQALAGEPVGCRQIQDGLWQLFLGPLLLGCIDHARIDLGLIRVSD